MRSQNTLSLALKEFLLFLNFFLWKLLSAATLFLSQKNTFVQPEQIPPRKSKISIPCESYLLLFTCIDHVLLSSLFFVLPVVFCVCFSHDSCLSLRKCLWDSWRICSFGKDLLFRNFEKLKIWHRHCSNLTGDSTSLCRKGNPPHWDAHWPAYQYGSLQSWICNLQLSDCGEAIPEYQRSCLGPVNWKSWY